MAKQNPMAYRIECYKRTSAEWHPNINLEWGVHKIPLVRVSLLGLSTGQYRVCVWGGDDFGMERDFDSKIAAKRMYEIIAMAGDVTPHLLLTHGFAHA
jgi:hypothetical protein